MFFKLAAEDKQFGTRSFYLFTDFLALECIKGEATDYAFDLEIGVLGIFGVLGDFS